MSSWGLNRKKEGVRADRRVKMMCLRLKKARRMRKDQIKIKMRRRRSEKKERMIQ